MQALTARWCSTGDRIVALANCQDELRFEEIRENALANSKWIPKLESQI